MIDQFTERLIKILEENGVDIRRVHREDQLRRLVISLCDDETAPDIIKLLVQDLYRRIYEE